VIHKLLLLYSWFVRTITFFFPDTHILMRFRGWLYSLGLRSHGRNFQVAHSTILLTLERISVGHNVYIAHNCVLIGRGDIILEDEVAIGQGVVISSSNRTKSNGSFRFGSSKLGTVFVGRGSWIGANCTLVAGSYLPCGSILGAGALLNRNFGTPNALYAGVPAKLIKEGV
jgi:acetyltransferase-like isoleucine patch superfamily enzyme